MSEDKKIETEVLNILSKESINVPEIIAQEEDCIVLNYYKGIRVFNLIVAIDNIKNKYPKGSVKRKKLDDIAKKILSKCEESQRKIQSELYHQFKDSSDILVYPIEKLTDIINLIFSCIKVGSIDRNAVMQEMNTVYSYFVKYAKVPFRDASIKNMILVRDDLYLKNFQDEEERNNYMHNIFNANELESIIESDIIDIDFSSCINKTTIYDDVISLRFHERTAPYFQLKKDFETWDSKLNKETVDINVLVATFVIRFLRFGGRKLLYRIIAPDLREKRFKHDNEFYYFKKLQEIIKLYKVRYLPETIKLLEKIENILASGNRKDFFIIQYDDENIINKINEIRGKETYSDVFPY